MGLSLRKLNAVWSGADFWDKKENQKQRQQYAAPAPQQQAAPAARPVARVQFRPPQQRQEIFRPPVKPLVFGQQDDNGLQIGDLNVNAPKPKVTGKPGKLPGVIDAAIQGERTTAKVLARVLPGGQNDLKAENQAIDRQNADRKFIMDSSLPNDRKAKILKSMNANQKDLSKSIEETRKSIPTRGQAAAGVVSTAIDALSGGTAPEIKGLSTAFKTKKAKVAFRAGTNAVAGATNAASAGGDAKSVAENAVAGAALPEILSGGKLVRAGANKVKSKVSPVTDTGKLLKPGKPKFGQNANDNLDNIVNTYVNNSGENITPRNPVVRFTTKAQEKLYRQPVDKVRDAANTAITKGLTSDSKLASRSTAIPTLISNRFGLKDSVRNITRMRNGTQENAGRTFMHISKDIHDRVNSLPDSNASMDRLSRFFFDKDTVKTLHGSGVVSSPRKAAYNQLEPEEKAIADQLMHINKHTNNINYQIGKINKEQYLKGTSGRHTPRIFDFEGRTKGKGAGSAHLMDTGVSRQRKDITKFDKNTIASMEKNPMLAILARSETAIRDQATHDAMQAFKKEGLIRKNPPKNNRNFSKLDSNAYGKLNGHYIYNPIRTEIDGHIHANTDWGQHLTDIIDMFQNSKLGTADRFFKSTKTTLSPGTFLGNIVSNPVAFNSASGVNAASQTKNMVGAAGRLVRDAYGKFDRGLYEARKKGVAVNDTGRQLTGDRRKEYLGVDKKSHSKNPAQIAGHAYGGVDQAAQLALYTELRKRGLDPHTAARRVQLGTQDYGGVGRAIQNFADSPVLGKPFARFTPELLRIVKNNLLYNPVGTAAKATGVVAGANALSNASHETPQERAARESATGQTQIPGTGFINKAVTGGKYNEPLGLNFAIPGKDGGSSVNIARLTGLNYPIDPGGDAKSGLVNQLSPFALPYRRDAQGKNVVAPAEAVSSLTLRPIADQIANRDFMGRSISDPNNKTYIEGVGDKGKKYVSNLSTHDQANNRVRTALTGYAPLFNEIYSGKSAVQKKPDYYGKERTKPQAALRAIGLKVESNSKDARQSRMDTQQYFEGRVAQVNDFLNKHPELKDAYAQIQSKTVDRKDNTRVNDTISPEKWKVIDAHPALFGQLKTEALYDNQHSKNLKGKGKPVDPIFKINDTVNTNEAIRLRSLPTGDDQERKEILKATAPWYNQFSKDEQQFYKDNNDYYNNLKKPDTKNPPKNNPRQDAYNNIKYPDQPSAVQQYYATKDKDVAAGKAFYRSNANTLNKAFDDYKQQQLDYTNAKRSIEGAAPIPKSVWDSVTFGYETDAQAAKELASKGGGSSRGFSSSRSSSAFDPASSYSNPHKYDVSLKGSRWRKVSVKNPQALKKAKVKAKSGKPKVAMKVTKSKV